VYTNQVCAIGRSKGIKVKEKQYDPKTFACSQLLEYLMSAHHHLIENQPGMEFLLREKRTILA
jgi:hypothetical protein